MLHEASAQQASSPLVSILFRLFTAMHCGAVLLDETKRILSLSQPAQKHLGEALSTSKGRLCATDRGCDALLQTILDQSLKYGERERDWPPAAAPAPGGARVDRGGHPLARDRLHPATQRPLRGRGRRGGNGLRAVRGRARRHPVRPG